MPDGRRALKSGPRGAIEGVRAVEPPQRRAGGRRARLRPSGSPSPSASAPPAAPGSPASPSAAPHLGSPSPLVSTYF